MEELLCDCKGVKFYNNHIEHNGKVYPFTYNENVHSSLTQEEKQTALYAAKEAVKTRMHHCMSNLLEHLKTSKVRNQFMVGWENGHFTVPIYQGMKMFLTIKSWEEADIPQCQQVLRAIYTLKLTGEPNKEKEQDLYNAFQIASELIICLSWNEFVNSH